MSNKIFLELFLERVNVFRAAFSSVATEVFYDEANGRLRHTGEYGTYREAIVREFLSFVIPRSLLISTGFVITAMDDVSTQCDVVVFDPHMTPLYVDGERQRFFPVEAVFCIGEVKSSLSKAELKKALNKLARVKALGQRIIDPVILRKAPQGQFDPVNNPYDAVPTFLLCQKLNFDLSNFENEVDSLYDPDVPAWHKHNMILSVEDGISLYIDQNEKVIQYPTLRGTNLKHVFIAPADNPNVHFHYFGSYMFMMSVSKTLLYPEFGGYAGGFSGCVRRTEQGSR